jgi:excisionase family DNA binding protein
MGDLLTVAEFAAALRIKPQTVRTWLWRGKLSRVRVSRKCVRIPTSELARLTRNLIPARVPILTE